LHTARPLRRLLQAVWYGRSIRVQLFLMFILIDIMAALIAGSVAIARARTQTRAEMASSMRLTEFLVSDAAKLVHHRLPAEQFLAALPEQLHSMRHLRIAVKDAAGMAVAAPALGRPPAKHAAAPTWFSALVAPPVNPDVVPVIVDGRTIGRVEIIGEPADEIAEIWQNLVAIGTLAAVLNIAMIGILYFLFGRVLDPLGVLANGLSDLEHHSYGVRLPHLPGQELAGIADRFNALAGALETARAENSLLNRRLITAQDDERRRMALELHDEVGPCLFGLKAHASSIGGAGGGDRVAERARDILAIIEHLQAINRSMLERLRPMALGHVPLEEMLDQLVRDRGRAHTQIAFTFAANDLRRSFGDSIDLTVYRCIQESLTNAIRHARAKNVGVELAYSDSERQIALVVRDDGSGMPPSAPSGFGIRGMRERVEGLGGRHVVESEAGRGTCVRVAIPVVEPQSEREVP
jgi:two-component system, NarL family, sensor histidine kinase UhpB